MSDLRTTVEQVLEGWTLPAAVRKMLEAALAESTMNEEMRTYIEGMSVSVDVSTDEHNACNRYFGTVTEVMDDNGDKHGVTLLVQNAKPNFDLAQSYGQGLKEGLAEPCPSCGWTRGISGDMEHKK